MKITFDDKVGLRSNPLDRVNKLTADDINEIKSVVNNMVDSRLYSFELTLIKNDLNNINTLGPLEIPLSSLGCDPGETINIVPQLSTAKMDPDGSGFAASDPIFIGLNSSTAVSAVLTTSFLTTITQKKVSNLQPAVETEIIENPLTISCGSDLTGGGAGATLTIKIVYQIINA